MSGSSGRLGRVVRRSHADELEAVMTRIVEVIHLMNARADLVLEACAAIENVIVAPVGAHGERR